MAVTEYGEQLLAVQPLLLQSQQLLTKQWLLQNMVSNCWLCSSNGCYRIW